MSVQVTGGAEHFEYPCTCTRSKTFSSTAPRQRGNSIRKFFRSDPLEKIEKCQEHDRESITTATEAASPTTPTTPRFPSLRKHSIQHAFSTLMSKTIKKRPSLPWSSGSSTSSEEPSISTLRQQEDIQQGEFCNCLIGLINRNEKYSYLITRPVRRELVRGSTA